MAKRLRVGIVGCGAIGSSLAKIIVHDFSARIQLVALFDIDAEKSRCVSKRVSRRKNLAVKTLAECIRKGELIIEAASAKCSAEIAAAALRKSRNVILMSVGGVVSRISALRAIARRHNAKIYIPSGAIAGIDAVKAAAVGRIKKVTLTTRKPPASFKGVRYVQQHHSALERITADTVLFSGKASEAMKFFPQNINVAGVLSIAGVGDAATMVRIIASPSLKKNIHEIEVEAESGKIFSRTENIAHPDNPKTSYLAVLSAAATLLKITEPVEVGT